MGLNLSRDWCMWCSCVKTKLRYKSRCFPSQLSRHFIEQRGCVLLPDPRQYRWLSTCLLRRWLHTASRHISADRVRERNHSRFVLTKLKSLSRGRRCGGDSVHQIAYTYLSRLAWKIWRPNHLDFPSLTWSPNDRKATLQRISKIILFALSSLCRQFSPQSAHSTLSHCLRIVILPQVVGVGSTLQRFRGDSGGSSER